MKRTFQLLALILVLAWGTALAQDVFIDGTVSPEVTTDTVMPGVNFTINFWFQNATEPATGINGYSATWQIYSPDSVTQISYVDLGGAAFGLPAYINAVAGQGWRPSFTAGEFYWSTLNTWSMFDMDGNLPDTFNHTAAGVPPNGSWPATDTKDTIRFQIGVISSQEGTVCVDSINYAPDDTYDWLWLGQFPTWHNGEPFCFVINDKANPVGETDPAVPLEYALKQNYPNPFNPATTITYSLEKLSHVELSIYNVLGQRIKTLVDQEQPANVYNVTWNGDTDDGRPAASGIYFYEIKAGTFNKTMKMMLLK